MLTFSTFAGVGITLMGSSVADKVLHHYGKADLAETLRVLTHLGALGYGVYFAVKLLQSAAYLFL